MSILKKIFYNKTYTDYGTGEKIAKWTLSPWKVFIFFLTIAFLFTIIYGYYFSGDPPSFFGNLLFYIIIIIIAIAIIYVLASTVSKFRKLFFGFVISLVLIFVVYWGVGLLFHYTGLIENWHMGGYTLWILLVGLAGMGAKNIDGDLDKKDVFFGLLVLLVIIGVNIPFANNMGFIGNVDALISKILGLSPWKF
jgi:hypothetical protein